MGRSKGISVHQQKIGDGDGNSSENRMADKLGLRARNREIEVLKCFEKKKERLLPSDDLHLGRWDVEKLTQIDIHEISTVFRDLRDAGYIELAPGYEMTSPQLYDLTAEGQKLLDTFIEVKRPEELADAETLYTYIEKYENPDIHHWAEFNLFQYRTKHRQRFMELLDELKEQKRLIYSSRLRSVHVALEPVPDHKRRK